MELAEIECAICFEPEGELMKVPCSNCRTDVHGKCLVEWLLTKPTCPICRTTILGSSAADHEQNAILSNLLDNPDQLVRMVCVALISIGTPWLFFLTDIVLGLAGFTYLHADQNITPALASCMVGSIFAHLVTGCCFPMPGYLLQPPGPQPVVNSFVSTLALPLASTLCVLSIMCYTLFGQEMVTRIGVVESILYMLMSYILLFVVTVSAMVRFDTSSWKINLICMRIAFVFIMSNASSTADTKTLVVSCSMVATVLAAISSGRFRIFERDMGD